MQITRKAMLGLVLMVILSATVAIPEACAAQDLWAWVKKEQRYVTPSTFSMGQGVPGTARLVGTFAYSIGINNYGPSVVRNATVAFTSTLSPKDLIAETWGVGPFYDIMPSSGTYAFRYTWAMPDISPKSYQVVWFKTPIRCSFTPGFDSSREVTPILIESASAMQTVRVKVKPTQLFSALYVGVSLSGSDYVKVELVKGSDRPQLGEKYSTHMFWWVDYPQVNRVYEFSVQLELTNLVFPSRVDFVPWTEVQAYESRQVNAWSSSEWHGTTQADPDISVWDVEITAPGNSQSKVALEVTRTVGYLGASTQELETTTAVEGVLEKTENLIVSSTSTSIRSTTVTFTSQERSIMSVLSFPFDAIVVVSLLAFSSYSAYKWSRARANASTRRGAAFVEYLARLEDLRSRNEISQATYQKLKDEYWTRMRNSAGSP